ncbi:hypothetical protein STEG23_037989 [Scotinomys teguina]
MGAGNPLGAAGIMHRHNLHVRRKPLTPALSRKVNKFLLRWLSDPETQRKQQDGLQQIQDEFPHLLVTPGSNRPTQEDFVAFQQGPGQSASPVEVVDVLSTSWALLWMRCGIILQKAHHQDCQEFGEKPFYSPISISDHRTMGHRALAPRPRNPDKYTQLPVLLPFVHPGAALCLVGSQCWT